MDGDESNGRGKDRTVILSWDRFKRFSPLHERFRSSFILELYNFTNMKLSSFFSPAFIGDAQKTYM